jgi:aminoglycoside phosphotransferase family enzyme/predicted kinase
MPDAPDPQQAVIHWLTDPQAYPHCPARVERVGTHISHVFLAAERVYKLKKAVKFDFLDFSTLAAREQACRDEVRLNRRLAPHTYLGVVPVVRSESGEFRIGGEGPAVEWLVEMQRLPTHLTLDALHRRGELRPEAIDRLAQTLVQFYRTLSPLPVSAEEYRQRCLSHVRGNQRELLAVHHHLPRDAALRVGAFQLQLLALKPEIFHERVRAGRIVEGHGDLRPEHICLSDPIAIFDCIEFSLDFRRIDVVDELAFLAAECDFLGADWVGPRVLDAYQQTTGDRPPAVLVDFYKSYRACVRAKVAALRADQLSGDAQTAAASDARRHLDLADRYAAPWVRPLVLVVGGLAGTGKTTLAKALSAALGAELLRTDEVRRELFASNPKSDADGRGRYSVQSRHRVYDELLSRAGRIHAQRVSVVLDGTFSTVAMLERARGVAMGAQAAFLAVECVCRPEIARQRIAERLTHGLDASEATPEIHDQQRERWEPWPSDIRQVQIDTELPPDEQVEQVLAALRQAANGSQGGARL